MHRPYRSNDITSGVLHAIGIGLAVAALVLMVVYASLYESARKITTVSIFGSGLILLYTASAVYHLLSPKLLRAKTLFWKLDYSMIFVLIAATYTPLCLVGLRGGWGWSIFGINWGLAIVGIALKVSPSRVPIWVYSILYLVMGWLIVIAIQPLRAVLSGTAIGWLVLGGIIYTTGVIFYALEKFLPPIKHFGWHEIFHLFVIAGSFSHFWLMLHYL